ncbi:unnamed protein product [Angiostrongylus costaricensis]|uniref:Guanylate cyclase n=1 Tax=Angiostrongylus costaricensis TaxID=334426 RepID=A0A158PIQ5_ANGCS|nr:unnamed protein product [Angiostrongylus costaricensis]
MCARDLQERKILPINYTLTILTMESCNKFSGVEHAAYLHYIKNATVYFGPGCNNEMLVIGRLAPRWNVPIIAHMSGDDALSDRSVFSTLGSVALTSASEMARAILTFLQLNNWNQIGFVRASTNYERLSLQSLSNLLKNSDIKVNVVADFDKMSLPDEIILSGKLESLSSKARIIIVELGMDINSATNFMLAVQRYDMKTKDYVYIIPWLAHTNDQYPWEAATVDKQEVKAAFENVIIITAHGYDKKFFDDFQEKFSQATGMISSHYATLTYMSLYDALFLYGLALRDAYEEIGGFDVHQNGSLIWSKMTNRQFIGVTGQVLMNHKAIRVPSYATYHITNSTMRIVVELEAKIVNRERCEKNTNQCSEHVAREVTQFYWPSSTGQLPKAVPSCGFTGSDCDYTVYFILLGATIFLLTVSPLSYFVYLKHKEQLLYDMTWRIPRDSIRFMDSKQSRSEHSLASKSQSSGSFSGSVGSKPVVSARHAMSNGVRIAFVRFQQTRNVTFPKTELKILKELKLTENENLNKFYGIAFNQQNEFIVMWLFCSRGSLEDILFDDELKLGRNFQVSFAKDIVKGLSFLHSSPLQIHGLLCLQNCLVDSNWTVKLTNFGTEWIISEKLCHNEIKLIVEEGDDESDRLADRRKAKYVQQAPEIIRELVTRKALPRGSQPADIYSLGMVLYQILFRVQPFHERGKSVAKLMEMISMSNDDDQLIRPTFPSSQGTEGFNLQATEDFKLLSCIEACWLELPEMRPHIKRVRSMVNANLRSTGKGSLVDQMMKMMEEYTSNLENMVRDRTALLEEAQKQADRLLNSMLPKSVAEDLKVGKPVVPQLYSCATVLFSDIRGFTRISSTSTPLQVVTFLNDMFSGFDAIIAKHDAYKVETIGDAYMIVSGVPNENGNNHVQHIADIALKMRSFVSNFKLAHRPEELMMVRIGFHSGSVAAGVVGLAAPRYCLFGDTVNMASRMESTGVANKIQISEQSCNILRCFFQQFIVVERGKIEVKGKGECTTFYLEGKSSSKAR